MISRGHNCVQWRGVSCAILVNVLGISALLMQLECIILFMCYPGCALPFYGKMLLPPPQFYDSLSLRKPSSWWGMLPTLSLEFPCQELCLCQYPVICQKLFFKKYRILILDNMTLSRNLVSWIVFLFTLYPSQSIIFQEFNIPVYTAKCLKNCFTVMPGAICGPSTSGDRIIIASWMVRWFRHKIQYYYFLSWTTPLLVTIIKIWLSQE